MGSDVNPGYDPGKSQEYIVEGDEGLSIKVSNAGGLCRYCGNALLCTFVRDESGVWNCEEFLEL